MSAGADGIRASKAIAAGSTIADAYASMTRAFAAAGIETPDLDARMLLCAILEIDSVVLISRPDQTVGDKAAALRSAAGRRLAREPVSRILGVRDFYGRSFEISPATLDPRPDSETLIDAALSIVRAEGWSERPLQIVDVGTGSGCLLVTLLAELPNATGVATDISPEAIQVAMRNAARHGVSARISFRIADALEGMSEAFDLLLTNPPYIATAELAGLQPEVRDHDPRAALDGGDDGLGLYRRIIARISYVVPTGYAVFEIGSGQAAEVSALLQQEGRLHGWRPADVIEDLGCRPRCVAQRTRRSS